MKRRKEETFEREGEIESILVYIDKNHFDTASIALSSFEKRYPNNPAISPLRRMIQNISAERGYVDDSITLCSPADDDRVESMFTSTQFTSRLEHWEKYIIQSEVKFKNIIGCEDAKQALYESIVLPLMLPNHLSSTVFTGIRGGIGNVLLHGQPGTGKTMLVEATANEAGVHLLLIKPSDILSKYQGQSEAALKSIFLSVSNLSSCQSCILFFDEFDSIACARSSSGDDGQQSRRLLSELLLQLNLHKSVQNSKRIASRVIVVAATNRIEDIDIAIVRRFQTRAHVGVLQNSMERKLLIAECLKSVEYDEGILDEVSTWTEGWSGSDIHCLCRDSALNPLKRLFPRSEILGSNAQVYQTLFASLESQELDLAVNIEDFRASHQRVTSLP
eukprot:GSChrysophyteH1.ASY1.ANO1.440.1 assembled CDS